MVFVWATFLFLFSLKVYLLSTQEKSSYDIAPLCFVPLGIIWFSPIKFSLINFNFLWLCLVLESVVSQLELRSSFIIFPISIFTFSFIIFIPKLIDYENESAKNWLGLILFFTNLLFGIFDGKFFEIEKRKQTLVYFIRNCIY